MKLGSSKPRTLPVMHTVVTLGAEQGAHDVLASGMPLNPPVPPVPPAAPPMPALSASGASNIIRLPPGSPQDASRTTHNAKRPVTISMVYPTRDRRRGCGVRQFAQRRESAGAGWARAEIDARSRRDPAG